MLSDSKTYDILKYIPHTNGLRPPDASRQTYVNFLKPALQRGSKDNDYFKIYVIYPHLTDNEDIILKSLTLFNDEGLSNIFDIDSFVEHNSDAYNKDHSTFFRNMVEDILTFHLSSLIACKESGDTDHFDLELDRVIALASVLYDSPKDLIIVVRPRERYDINVNVEIASLWIHTQ